MGARGVNEKSICGVWECLAFGYAPILRAFGLACALTWTVGSSLLLSCLLGVHGSAKICAARRMRSIKLASSHSTTGAFPGDYTLIPEPSFSLTHKKRRNMSKRYVDAGIDLGGMILPKNLVFRNEPQTLYLIAWIARVGTSAEQTVDASIHGDSAPTMRSSKNGETYRTVMIAEAHGRDYEHAASKLHEAVAKHPALAWVKNMPTYKRERGETIGNLDLVGR